MDQETNLRKGIFLALIASIISGVAIFYSKVSLAKISPLILTTARNSFVGLLFIFYFVIFGKFRQLGKLAKKDWFYILLIGLIGGSLPFYLFFSGLQLVGAQTANLIHKSLFIWVTILAMLFLKERPNVNYWLAFLLVIVANYMISPFRISFGKGELLVFSATLLWAVENIFAKKILQRVSSETVGLFRMGIGGVTLLLITLATGKGNLLLSIFNQPFDFAQGKQLVIIIIGGSILFGYVFFWYKALKYAPASLVTLVLTFSVVVGNILNGSLAGVKILPREIQSSLIITVAISIILLLKLVKKVDFSHDLGR